MATSRHLPVIPADFQQSMPERRVDYPGRLGRPKAPVFEKPHTYSQNMTAAGILLASTAMVLFLAGSPVASSPEVATTIQEASKEGTKDAIVSWSFDIFPLAGAMLSAAGICLLHNDREDKSRIAGRVIFALIGGFVAPWVVEMLPLTWRIDDPRGQLLIGVAFGSMGYIFSRYVVEAVFKRAPAVAGKVVDAGERRLDKELKTPQP